MRLFYYNFNKINLKFPTLYDLWNLKSILTLFLWLIAQNGVK